MQERARGERSRERWYGSVRISRDDRVSYSPWTFPDLPLAFWVWEGHVTVLRAGVRIMYLYLDDRERVESACFDYQLGPDELLEAVSTLRRAKGGLARWVVPALEWNFASSGVRHNRPDTFKAIPEILASCWDLPVAHKWKRVRVQYFLNQGMTPPELPRKAAVPPRRSRRKRRKVRPDASKRTTSA